MTTRTPHGSSTAQNSPLPLHVHSDQQPIRGHIIALASILLLCGGLAGDPAIAQIPPPNPPVHIQSATPEVRINKYVASFSQTNHWRLEWPIYSQFIDFRNTTFEFTDWTAYVGGTYDRTYDSRELVSWNSGIYQFKESTYIDWVPLPALGTKTYKWSYGNVWAGSSIDDQVKPPVFPKEHVDAVWSNPTPQWLIDHPEGGDATLFQDDNSKTAQTFVEFFSGGYPASTTNRMWALQFQGWDQTANAAVMDAAYLTNFAGVTIGGVSVDASGIAYFRMKDYTTTNVTPLLPAAFSNYTYEISATELTSSIAFDGNHDGQIDLYGTNDLTTSAAPFVFWVNNDRDVWSNDDQDFIDVNPAAGNDYTQDWIHNARDLEDYNRLAIRIPAVVCRDTNWQCRISYGGKIKLFTYPYDDNRHVQDYDFAQNTLVKNWSTTSYSFDTGWGYYVGESVSASPLNLPRNLLETRAQFERPNGPNGPEYARFNFLFKGGSAGKHRIKLDLYYAGNLVSRSGAWLNLMDIENMYDHVTAGDNTTTGFDIQPSPVTLKQNVQTGLTDDYVLFVHGWRMQTWERRKFAETAYKRLWWNGYRGHFGLFSWPTEYVASEILGYQVLGTALVIYDNQNFDRSEWQAWRSGTPLAAHLLNLNSGLHQGKVRLFAHSMGNIVCAEALRLLSTPGAASTVHTYVSCQGALASHSYDPTTIARSLTLENPEFASGYLVDADSGTRNIYANYPNSLDACYLDGIGGAARFINYFNIDDYALGCWCANQSLKPDIGLTGIIPNPAGAYRYDSFREFWQGWWGTDGIPVVRFLNKLNADRYEIFGMAAEARCYATGAQQNVGGAFIDQLNLQAAYGFGNPSSHHSAQFNSSIQRRTGFWRQLLVNDFDIH